MKRIEQIWNELSVDQTVKTGFLLRRFSGDVFPDIYVALQNPEKLPAICISIDNSIDINITNFFYLQELKIEVFPSPEEEGKNLLVFKLLNFEHKDIFNILCEDLIMSVSNETNQHKLTHLILNRFEKWKSLFVRLSGIGLSSEEQRGLFGELFLLRQLLNYEDDYLPVMISWVGPENENQDFQNLNWAVEVKTTHGNNHQRVHISNERQLDTKNLSHLFLYHLSLEQRKNAGESLNDLVDSINTILRSNSRAQSQFNFKLYEAGYFEKHKKIYTEVGYFTRQDFFYEVIDNFPRIEEDDVREGVGDIKYSIIISQCSNYRKEKDYVLNLIKFQL